MALLFGEADFNADFATTWNADFAVRLPLPSEQPKAGVTCKGRARVVRFRR